MTICTFDYKKMLSTRSAAIDTSGIRKVFELGRKLRDPINLSIGQPDFPVPDSIKEAAIEAIRNDRNGYTVTQGIEPLRNSILEHLREDVGWTFDSAELGMVVTSGTNGGLLLTALAMLNPGDEVIVPDPYFVVYPAIGTICGATVVHCDTYPDFRLTAERIEPLITKKTKLLTLNSPSNPAGVVLTNPELRDIVDLCERHGVVIVSDEIYDEFTFSDAREGGKCPSPARFTRDMLLVRGFGKTYGCTGWRMGYIAGPALLTSQISKLQQYSFVCAPSIAQWALVNAYDIDMSEHVAAYARRRDMLELALGDVTNLIHAGGSFYSFIEVPKRLGMSASQFAEKALERKLLVIPGTVFSRRDTHFRVSFAVDEKTLSRGLAELANLLRG
jgi:aminotransferase